MTRKIKCKGEYCCDFETTSLEQYKLEGETRVYLYKLVDMKATYEHYGINIEDFINTITSNPNIEKIYFHNLSFDGTFIINYLLRKKWTWKEELKSPTKEKSFGTIIDDFGSIYQIKISFENRIIEFSCSYKLTGLSIKDLGKLVGLDKLNETHDYTEIKNYKSIEEITEEEKMYITNDVEIMRRAILKCYEMGIRGMTKSSACYKMWQHMTWEKIKSNFVATSNEKIDHIINASYRGGITMINKLYANKVLEECRDYDVNSLYPSVMYNPMPCGEPIMAKQDKDIPENYDLRIYEVYVKKAKVLNGYIPFIPTTKAFIYKDSYDYPYEIEDITLYIWGSEFDLFKTYYEGDYQVINIVGYKHINDMFKDYLEKFRVIKENAPNPSPERQFAKLCMNSLYGKFAQTSDRVSKEPYLGEDDLVEYKKYTTNIGSGYDRKIASIITSYARCVLIKAIEKNPKRFIYCDTDSIYILGDYDYDIPTDSKKFGFWKYEASYFKFKGLKAKCYISTMKPTGEIHSAVAGLPKEAQKLLTFENFHNGLMLTDVKKQLMRVKGGIVIVSRPFTIKVEESEVISSEK